MILTRGDHFRFDSVFFLKNNQTELKKKPKPVQTDRFRFGSVFLDKNRFKPVWLVFFRSGFGRFFQFQAYKTETKPISFFKILIGFFHGSVFSIIFFSVFSVF